MTVTTSTAASFTVEHSWEATTLDYLSPNWYTTQEGFATEAEAEAFRSEKQTAACQIGQEPIAYRVVRVPSQVERDEWLEAEFAANARYWADRAQAAKAAEEAQALYAQRLQVGRPVRVVKGRKVAIGTEGHVFWAKEGQWGWRIGFKTPEGEAHFISADNVEVIEAVTAGVAA